MAIQDAAGHDRGGRRQRSGPRWSGSAAAGALGSGVVIARGPGADRRPRTCAARRSTVVFADGTRARRRGRGRRPGARPGGAVGRRRGDAPAVAWEPAEAPGIGSAVRRAREPRRARPARDARVRVVRRRAASAGRAAGASAGRSSTPRRSRAAPPAARSSTPAGSLLGVNSIRLDGGLILAAAGERRRCESGCSRSPAARRPWRTGSASPWRRPAWRGGCAARSACPERDGLLVRAVEDGSPAAEAGIERGDLIVARRRRARSTASTRSTRRSTACRRRAASSS